MKSHVVSTITVLAVAATFADDLPAVSAACRFAIDTVDSPRFVKTTDELAEFSEGAWRATWQVGDTVTLTAPDGTVQTLASDAAASGSAAVSPSAGGVWTLSSVRSGTFEIAVRHTLFGTEGDGTAVNPRKVVDDDEVASLDASSLVTGFCIALCGPASVGLGSLSLGDGFVLAGQSDGTWRVVASEDGVAAASASVAWKLDSRPSPLAVKTAVELAQFSGGWWRVTWRAGDTVTVTAPDGTVQTLAADASAAGSSALTFDAGGLWTLVNSAQGEAQFTVRHSFFGTQGAGTEASPAKIVDGDELADLHAGGAAGDGYVFTLNGAEGLLAALTVPGGFGLETWSSGDVWRMRTAANGNLCTWGEAFFAMDGERPGPDRRVYRQDVWPVASYADGLNGDASAASSLTVVSPSGRTVALALAGAVLTPVLFDEAGTWTLSLATDDAELTSSVIVRNHVFTINLR